jgi:hypothetical protein
MVRECTGTHYVLFWIVVVPASDPKDLFMGKVVQPLQSVNYHDSRAHDHEQHGPFT